MDIPVINHINLNILFNSDQPIMLSTEIMNKINTLIQKDLKKIEKAKKKKEKEYNKYLDKYLKNNKKIVITI